MNRGQRWLLRFIIFLLGRLVRLENRENLEVLKTVKDPIIFAFNHNCSYETLLIPTYLIYLRQGKKISFLIDWMYGRLPLLSWLIMVLFCFSVEGYGKGTEIILKGAGATFPHPLYKEWMKVYKAETGIRMSYQAIGSGQDYPLV